MMNMFRTLCFAALLAASLTIGAGKDALAQAAPGVAFVNIDELLKNSTANQSIQEQLKAKQKSLQSYFNKKEEELKKEEQELIKQRSVLSADAFAKKEQDFRNKYSSAQRESAKSGESVQQGFAKATNQIRTALMEIAAGVAKERGYVMVAPSNQMIYADPKLDITSEVTKKLNDKLPKVTVSFN